MQIYKTPKCPCCDSIKTGFLLYEPDLIPPTIADYLSKGAYTARRDRFEKNNLFCKDCGKRFIGEAPKTDIDETEYHIYLAERGISEKVFERREIKKRKTSGLFAALRSCLPNFSDFRGSNSDNHYR